MDNIGQFLVDIAQTYPVSRGVNAEKVIEDARTYLIGKLYKKEIDFQKAKTLMFDSKDLKTFPKPNVLYDYLAQCEIKHYNPGVDEGCLVVVTLPRGTIDAFEVCGYGKTTEEIKKEVTSKYGNVQIKTYPKGSVLIGNKVITP